ncbi:MAG: nicotinate phosphoribosyltransferase [Desulfuromonadales bacterium GWC2_61_20]|nr:MAG: nicotinate phosphoribosyltransferase [Desulfuromonadales bacterium GWC2_61_20]HAD04705.1 nicotinate phosphoribosyltransferase [Desulfuromonas sp.]
MRTSPLLTDLYELTMLAGYLQEGLSEEPATFDLFFRSNPFEGGYAVFAGLEPALAALEQLRFAEDELAYLKSLNLFRPAFLDYLRTFRFRGTVVAPPEGTVVFANTPLLSVSGTLAEAQFVETLLLNLVNFSTLVATKAARIVHAAGDDASVLEFGLRRAQGPDGGLTVARAACIGGVTSTSNVLAGQTFGLPLRGTHAHSWVMAFPDELAAFRAYADAFPHNCILLIDTYDTLQSGLPHALAVAAELRAQGHELYGVRIDSGDLAYLSREVRQAFDRAGYPAVKIVASNELDEFVIDSIRDEGGCVDIYGVGTRLATCAGRGGGALGGVYKLVECCGLPRLKVTSDMAKATLPGRKRVLRAINPDGGYLQDILALDVDDPLAPGDTVYDPSNPLQHTLLAATATLRDLRTAVMVDGKRTRVAEPLDALTARCREELARLPQGCLRFINPHRYKVSLSPTLNALRNQLIAERSSTI